MSFIINRKYFKKSSYYLETWTLFTIVFGSISNLLFSRSKKINNDFTNFYLHGRNAGKPELLVNMQDQIKCVSCGLCVEACPANSIEIKNVETKSSQLLDGKAPKVFMLDVNTCFNCGHCQIICPVNALGMDGDYSIYKDNNWINLVETAKKNKTQILQNLLKK